MDFSEPPPAPSVEAFQPVRKASILHPGNNRLLFSFPALDKSPTQPGLLAVNHRLVQDACRIISNNSDGFLATDREGTRVILNDVLLLEPQNYYFHLTSSPGITNYDIVANFASWTFPESLPTHWCRDIAPGELIEASLWPRGSLQMSDGVKALDQRCIITKYARSCENAHLVPSAQKDWFYSNDMEQHSLSELAGISDVGNGVSLRSDVRACLDRCGFVFYPVGGRYVAYFVSHEELEYAALFHRQFVSMHARVAAQFIYARFALNIFGRLPPRWSSRSTPGKNPKAGKGKTKNATKAVAKGTGTSALHIVHEVQEDDDDGEASDEDAGDASGTSMDRSGSPRHTELESMSALGADTAYEKRWTENLIKRFPLVQQLPDVVDPPDVSGTGCHMDTLRMRRLKIAYFVENPQVRQVCGPTTVLDSEDWDSSSDDDALEQLDEDVGQSACE
ncbi:hypothetical protein C8Q74DRAFT_1223058 [Fomes fomentarius]|nr:hypothetical protein C8Q74DRAFT_1223058 [Fomes fomentarius]